eukprot:CAMPEP_0114239446 /NCGR_PEP_ID=MMETSP0058-20121206/8468_1 /TAXON_ID=36894 /ORGANISM="Pyramimonas parkeae, CCMP726" /LENGTH=1229 /DNA_ID=CAMNT_0001351635 /DNA_START=373 /DNA_END=4062 /DNA_ORIENTATION=+
MKSPTKHFTRIDQNVSGNWRLQNNEAMSNHSSEMELYQKNLGSLTPKTPVNDNSVTPENIWVGVRLRPLSESEQAAGEKAWWKANSKHGIQSIGPVDRGTRVKSGYQDAAAIMRFQYDRVFAPEESSKSVYEDAVKAIVLSGMEGVNGTVFAYGQTASGKTYTMRTVVELAAEEIFSYIDSQYNREFLIRLSALEIYNEVVYDLLKDGRSPLRLLDDPSKGTIAEGLTEEPVVSVEHLVRLFATVERRRQVGETVFNAASSRSHQILRLTLESRPSLPAAVVAVSTAIDASSPSTPKREGDNDCISANPSSPSTPDTVLLSTLNFVDLAGSESYQTNGPNARRQEGAHINQSLLALGKVIRCLGEKSAKGAHVPYRDSRLTRILQASLGGNARTAIVCTVSTAVQQTEHTRNTLYFANQAKLVTNCAVVNELQDEKTLMLQYRNEIEMLKEKLAQLQGQHSSQNNKALQEVEAEMQAEATARKAAERRLKNLEKFILRANRTAVAGSPLGTPPTNGMAFKAYSNAGSPVVDSEQDIQSFPLDWNRDTSFRIRGTPKELTHDVRRLSADDADILHRNYQRNELFEEDEEDLGLEHTPMTNMKTLERRAESMLLGLLVRSLRRKQTPNPLDSEAPTPAHSPSPGVHGSPGEDAAVAEVAPARDTVGRKQIEQQVHDLQIGHGDALMRQQARDELQAELFWQESVSTHMREGERLEAVIEQLAGELQTLEEEKVVGEFLDAAKEEEMYTLRCEVARLRGVLRADEGAETAVRELEERLCNIRRALETYIGVFGSGVMVDGSELNSCSYHGSPLSQSFAHATPARVSPDTDLESQDSAHALVRSPSSSRSLCTSMEEAREGGASTRNDEGWPPGTAKSQPGPRRRGREETPALGGRGANASWFNGAQSLPTGVELRALRGGGGSGPLTGALAASTGRAVEAHTRASSDGPREPPEAEVFQRRLRDILRLKALCQDVAEGGVAGVREAMDGYRETVAKLECQKKMLMGQVLKLEFELEESDEQSLKLQSHNQKQRAIIEKRNKRIQELASSSRVAVAPGASYSPTVVPKTTAPQPVLLLSRIQVLWVELSVAYLHRSRFMLGFPVNGELFYYEAEHRRLLWLQTQIEKQTSSGMFSARGTSRMLKELKRERMRMYKRLRLLPVPEKEVMYAKWNIPVESKLRKKQLVEKICAGMDQVKDGSIPTSTAKQIVRIFGYDDDKGAVKMDLIFAAQHP